MSDLDLYVREDIYQKLYVSILKLRFSLLAKCNLIRRHCSHLHCGLNNNSPHINCTIYQLAVIVESNWKRSDFQWTPAQNYTHL